MVFRFCGHRCGTASQRFDKRHNIVLSNSSNTVNDRSVAVPSTKSGKTTSRTTNRLAFAAVATVGLMWPVLVLSATATADPAARPGVPCLDMVQSFAASPSAVPDALQTAADALAPPAPPARVPAPVPAPAGNDVETRSRPRPRWQLGLGRRRLGRRLAWWTGMAGSARTVRRRVLGALCRMAVGAARSLGLHLMFSTPARGCERRQERPGRRACGHCLRRSRATRGWCDDVDAGTSRKPRGITAPTRLTGVGFPRLQPWGGTST
jgi:hypothetical protein